MESTCLIAGGIKQTVVRCVFQHDKGDSPCKNYLLLPSCNFLQRFVLFVFWIG